MFLLTEEQYSVEMLTENTSKGKNLYIEGIFAQANLKNRNGRIYPRSVMESAVQNYITNRVDKHISIGELEHPPYPLPKPDQAAILVESLKWDGDNVIGKAKVLNTTKGKELKALLEDGFGGGVSTRGLGDVKEWAGSKTVNAFLLNAIDYVSTPSGIDCFPKSIMESTEWINESGMWVPKKTFNESEFLNNLDRYLENLKKNYK